MIALAGGGLEDAVLTRGFTAALFAGQGVGGGAHEADHLGDVAAFDALVFVHGLD